jgi:hypothetical protein
MAEFLTLNGIALQVLIEGANWEPMRLIDSARAENMSLIENLEGEKGRGTFTLQPMTRADAYAHRQLINGAGHYFSFDTSFYSSRGLAPIALTGGTIGAAAPAPWLGAGRALFALGAGNFVTYQTNVGVTLAQMTVMIARNVAAGGWNHYMKDLAGNTWLNGAATGALAWFNVAGANGSVVVGADAGNAIAYDELVILPYHVPASWAAQMYAFQNPAAGNTQWSSLKQLKLQGEVLPEGGTKIVHGRVLSEKILSAQLPTGFEQAARQLTFELVEV